MVQAAPTDTLVAGELAAIRAFLQFQGAYNNTKITGITTASIGDYMNYVNNLAGNYGAVQNTQWKGWYDQLFALLTATTDIAEIFQVMQFAAWVGANKIHGCPYSDCTAQDPWYSYWYVFRPGHRFGWWTNPYGSDAHAVWYGAQSAPGTPPPWQTAVQKVINQWGDTPPANRINVGANMTDNQLVMTSAQTVLNGWTAFPPIAQKTAAIGQGQQAAMTALLARTTLDADTYFFLLHLLIALATGATAAQQLAQRIVSAIATSQEYPNDTFINQLVYLVLLYLADPLGAYAWNNAQLQATLRDLEGVILATDPASTAIKASLVQHGKVLNSDASYPMHDPYTSIGFTQRKTDTMFALDKARQGLKT
ncbi:MAG: hypothetical protein ACTHMA_20475 [Thermomicrobiales bacterium]